MDQKKEYICRTCNKVQCTVCDKLVRKDNMKIHDHQLPSLITYKSNNDYEEKIAEIEKERDSIIENLSRYKQTVKTNGERLVYVALNMKQLQLEVNGKFDRLNEYVQHGSTEEENQLLKFIDTLQLEVQEKFDRLGEFIKSWKQVNHLDLILERSKSI